MISLPCRTVEATHASPHVCQTAPRERIARCRNGKDDTPSTPACYHKQVKKEACR